MTATLTETDRVRVLADKFIEFLETNRLPEGLLARDFFADVTVPTWRLQADSAEGLLAIRLGGHPIRGEVIRRLDQRITTECSFVPVDLRARVFGDRRASIHATCGGR